MKAGINFMHNRCCIMEERKNGIGFVKAPESTQNAAAAVIWREARKKIQLEWKTVWTCQSVTHLHMWTHL